MQANTAPVVIDASRAGNLDEVVKGLATSALKETAKEIIVLIQEVRVGSIDYEEARLRLSGMKHLIQLMALDRFKHERPTS